MDFINPESIRNLTFNQAIERYITHIDGKDLIFDELDDKIIGDNAEGFVLTLEALMDDTEVEHQTAGANYTRRNLILDKPREPTFREKHPIICNTLVYSTALLTLGAAFMSLNNQEDQEDFDLEDLSYNYKSELTESELNKLKLVDIEVDIYENNIRFNESYLKHIHTIPDSMLLPQERDIPDDLNLTETKSIFESTSFTNYWELPHGTDEPSSEIKYIFDSIELYNMNYFSSDKFDKLEFDNWVDKNNLQNITSGDSLNDILELVNDYIHQKYKYTYGDTPENDNDPNEFVCGDFTETYVDIFNYLKNKNHNLNNTLLFHTFGEIISENVGHAWVGILSHDNGKLYCSYIDPTFGNGREDGKGFNALDKDHITWLLARVAYTYDSPSN